MTCDRCFQDAAIGEHGVNLCPMEPRKGALVVSDEIPGGQWFENGFRTPQKFYSHSEHRAALAALGREPQPKWVPGDKHLTRWDSVNLEGAAALLSRTKATPFASADELAEFPITVTDVTFAKDA